MQTGSWMRKIWVWDECPDIHKPHYTMDPHGFMPLVLCVRRSVWYRKRNIMLVSIFNCDEFSSFNLIPWGDGTDSFSCVSLHRFYIEVVVLIRHVKGQLFAPYMVTQWYILHVRTTCKSSYSVSLMQDFSLLSLSLFPVMTPQQLQDNQVSFKKDSSLSLVIFTNIYEFSLNR